MAWLMMESPRFDSFDSTRASHVLTLLAREDELPRVEALHGHERLVVALEAVRVLELHLGHGRAAARLVHDVLHHALGWGK